MRSAALLALFLLCACGPSGPGPDGGQADAGPGCDPACSADQACQDGTCVDLPAWEAELQHCADVINSYRDQAGLAALARSAALEEFAAEGASYDSEHGGHAHIAAFGSDELVDAENEIPGWPLSWYDSVIAIIDQGTQDMWNEGPGGGHHDNIVGAHTQVGCGIYVTAGDEVWVVQDFK